MGLLFFPRGGAAQVARYLSIALADADWSVGLVAGSLGQPGEFTHAPTFFAGTALQHLDYSAAASTFEAGGDAIAAPVPMHPSYEDRGDAPDVVFAAVPEELADHLSSVWEAPLRAAGADKTDVFHLHHLTPQHDAVARHWPDGAVVAHLHGTEIKFLEAVAERAALAARVGTTLAGMPAWAQAHPDGAPGLDETQRQLLGRGRWESWQHGDAWRRRLLRQAAAADHLVVVSPTERSHAAEILRADPDQVSDVPNGVDVQRFRPRPEIRQARRTLFRRWLVEDPQGWDESAVPGTVAYGEADLDRLVGPDGEATVLIFVGRFTAPKRLTLLLRAFARAQPQLERPASLVVWGGYPGEVEGEHPVTVARRLGVEGVFFAGWRGHVDLPDALAVSDALVLPSVNDSYPQAPLEAMAVGLPVIAARSGGFPFMVNLEPERPTGWLVPPDDEPALVAVLVEAVNRPHELSARGEAALAHARQHLSWASRVQRFEDAYASAREVRARRRAH